MHGNNKSDEELRAAAEARRARRRSTRSTSPRARPRPVSRACSSASCPGSRRRPTRRSAPGTAAPSSGSTRTTRSRRSRGPRGRARGRRPARAHRLAARRRRGAPVAVDCSPSSRRAAAASSAGLRRTVDIGGGFGIRHVADEPEPSVEELVRDGRSARSSASGRARAAGPATDPRAGPVAGRARGVHALPRRRGQAGGDTTYVAIDGGMSDNPRPQLYGARYSALLANRADEQPRRRVHHRRQALRVGRRADRARRAARAAPRRHPGRPGHGRLHPRNELELQRRPAAGGGARRRRRRRV